MATENLTLSGTDLWAARKLAAELFERSEKLNCLALALERELGFPVDDEVPLPVAHGLARVMLDITSNTSPHNKLTKLLDGEHLA